MEGRDSFGGERQCWWGMGSVGGGRETCQQRRNCSGLDDRTVPREREFFIDNPLVRIHFIIEMTWWTGLAPWEFEFPFPGSLTSTFLGRGGPASSGGTARGSTTPGVPPAYEGRCKATWKREFTLPWREAGPPDQEYHLHRKVDVRLPGKGIQTPMARGRSTYSSR